MNKLAIACVCRSGGCYDELYVRRLLENCIMKLEVPFRFVCLTDLDLGHLTLEYARKRGRVSVIGFNTDAPGWWSKFELFRPEVFRKDESVLFFDLDTVIAKDITNWAQRWQAEPSYFSMLNDFYHAPRRASGLMAWHGDYSKVWKRFRLAMESGLRDKWNNPRIWEQEYLQRWLEEEYGRTPLVIQEQVGAISYKVHMKDGVVPLDGQIVCFHGTPKPHEINEPWMRSWLSVK